MKGTKLPAVHKVEQPCACGSEARAWPVDGGKQWAIACFSDECEREVVSPTLTDALIDWHHLVNGK